MLDSTIVSAVTQIGFAAVIALLLFRAYTMIVPTLIENSARTAAALEGITRALDENTKTLEHVRSAVAQLEHRLTIVEHDRHREGRIVG